MRALFRTPWSIFGIGLSLAIAGVAAGRTNPAWGAGASGLLLAAVTFGGLLLLGVSPALQDVRDGGEGLRKAKGALRWIVAWMLLQYAFGVLSDASTGLFDLLVGPVGSASRTIGAIGIGLFRLFVPLYLAGYGAEAIRRVALWIGEDAAP